MAVSFCHRVNDRPSLLLLNVSKQTKESLIGCLKLFNQKITFFPLNLMFIIECGFSFYVSVSIIIIIKIIFY